MSNTQQSPRPPLHRQQSPSLEELIQQASQPQPLPLEGDWAAPTTEEIAKRRAYGDPIPTVREPERLNRRRLPDAQRLDLRQADLRWEEERDRERARGVPAYQLETDPTRKSQLATIATADLLRELVPLLRAQSQGSSDAPDPMTAVAALLTTVVEHSAKTQADVQALRSEVATPLANMEQLLTRLVDHATTNATEVQALKSKLVGMEGWAGRVTESLKSILSRR